MPVTVTTSDGGDSVKISISGRFDFNEHSAFRSSYRNEKQSANYILDMAGTDYIDSSALGMLLLLREHAGGDKSSIRILNCDDNVMKIFKVSNFDSLFKFI